MYRWARLEINGVTIEHEENKNGGLYFEADYNSGKANETGSMKFRIYNLSQEIFPGSKINYDFGRQDDGGRFGTFIVKKRNVEKNGGDTVQVLFCSERAVESSNIVSVSLKGQIKSSEAIREICKNAGLEAVNIILKEDKIYNNSFSCYGKALDELKEIAENTGSKFKLEGKEVYFYTEKFDREKEQIVSLNFNSGLLKNPAVSEELTLEKETNRRAEQGEIEAPYLTDTELKSKSTKAFDYTVECLSNHYLKKGRIVQVEGSATWNGLARIVQLTMKNQKEWKMELKVKIQ